MPFKPFEIKMTEQQVIDGLKSTFGNELTAADIRGFCASRDISYSTVTRKIQQFKVSKGKWNLEVTPQKVKEIEKSFSAPAAQKNLVPEIQDTFVKFGSFADVKKIISSKLLFGCMEGICELGTFRSPTVSVNCFPSCPAG